MILRYGPYTHPLAEASVRRTVTPKRSDFGATVGFTVRWDIEGQIIADGPVAIAQRLAEMDAFYQVQGRDLTWETDSGVVVMALRSAGSVGGVQVHPPTLPKADGAEWATGLTFSMAAEAEYSAPTFEATLTAWQETLQVSGGGPRFVWLQPIEGDPIKQMTAQRTPYRMVQSGRAVGRYAYPPFPPPLYPNDLIEAPQLGKTGPTARNGMLLDYGIEWSYTMESVAPFDGNPTLPP